MFMYLHRLQAIACTSGGCIQSRQYGPFSTEIG